MHGLNLQYMIRKNKRWGCLFTEFYGLDGFQSCFPQIDISPSMRYNVTQKSCLKRMQKILFKQTMEKTLRAKIYHFLVNRKPGIRQRYHRFHDGTTGMKKVVSWFYLLWLNFCYYVLFCRFLGEQIGRAHV